MMSDDQPLNEGYIHYARGVGHCRQWLAFPVEMNPGAHAVRPLDSYPLFLLMELRDGQLAFLALHDRGVMLKPEEIARCLASRVMPGIGEVFRHQRCSQLLQQASGLNLQSGEYPLLPVLSDADHLLPLIPKPMRVAMERLANERQIDRQKLLQDLLLQTSRFRDALASESWQIPAESMPSCSIGGFNTLTGNHETRRNRMQFIRQFPWLLSYFSPEALDRDSVFAEQAAHLRRAVDCGEKFLALLGTHLRLPVEVVRWARGLSPERLVPQLADCFIEVLRCLSQLAPEKRPTTPEQWRILAHLYRELSTGLPDSKMTWLRAFAAYGWEETENRFRKQQWPLSAIYDTRDYLREVRRVLALHPRGAALTGLDCREWVHQQLEQALQSTSPFLVIAASIRWHRSHATSMPQPESEYQAVDARGQQWPVLFSGELPLRHHVCRFLQNQQELAAEGLALQHCVGTFVGECSAGAAHILSIRSRDRLPLATVELRLYCRSGQYGFDVMQKRGLANAPISSSEEQALTSFLQLVHQPRLQARLKQLHAQQKAVGSLHQRLPDGTPAPPDAERQQKLLTSLPKQWRRTLFAESQAILL